MMGRRWASSRLTITEVNPDTKTSKDTKLVHSMTDVKKTMLTKNGIISGGHTQAEIDSKITRVLKDFRPLFDGIGMASIPLIHI